MSRPGDEDREAERNEARHDARIEALARRHATQCRCGDGLPGVCPGPVNCPYAGDNDPDFEDQPEADCAGEFEDE
jgi:hypothetical protein